MNSKIIYPRTCNHCRWLKFKAGAYLERGKHYCYCSPTVELDATCPNWEAREVNAPRISGLPTPEGRREN